MKIADFQKLELDRTRVLAYGPPKCGKSALALELAEFFNLHWIDLENGSKLFHNPKHLKPEWAERINYIPIPDHQGYPIAADTVREILKGGLKRICFTHGKVDCAVCKQKSDSIWSEIDLTKFGPKDILVLDTMTQLGKSMIAKVVKKQVDKLGDEYKFEWDDYRKQGFGLDTVLSRIQAAPINSLILSHETDVEKDEKKSMLAPVAGTGNFSSTVGKYFDELVYVYKQNGKHKISNATGFRNDVQSGGRSGVDLSALPRPSLVPLFDPSKYDEMMKRPAL